MTTWAIYYGDPEFAATMGTPVLGYVLASSKAEAERLAASGRWLHRAPGVSPSYAAGFRAVLLGSDPAPLPVLSGHGTR